jgi:hypothetical protein
VNEYSAIMETRLKDLSNPESACLENFLDVSRNGGRRWNDDLAVEISKDLNEFRIGNDGVWAIASSNP